MSTAKATPSAQLAAAVGHELVSCLRAGDAAACADPSRRFPAAAESSAPSRVVFIVTARALVRGGARSLQLESVGFERRAQRGKARARC